MTTFILSGYFGILAILAIFGAHRLHITYLYRKHRNDVVEPKDTFEDLPHVTIQLPVFNEKFVMERLIDVTMAMDYPRERLQVQVLDDSTDETTELARKKVEEYAAQGYDIVYIHRVDRSGYKAGALEHGLKTASGEFVAVFDADFLPAPDFLQRTIHHFTDDRIGMIQACWGHLNRHFSTLTEVQSIMLDAHFLIEHGGRSASGLFFNFNGTAGIWRRATIADAGGWEHDTLTEDLDLSYRAQLKGWQFRFLPKLVCPAELPTTMTAFKSQQHRWAKGSIQVMRKMLPTIWRSEASFAAKMEATFHLTGNLAYLLMIINSIFFVIPSMIVRGHQDWREILFIDGPVFILLSMSFVIFYLSSQKAAFGSVKGRRRFIPALMAVGIGLGINNTRAVIEALRGKQSEFVRTPKTGSVGNNEKHRLGYKLPRVGWGYLEIAAGFLYSVAIGWAVIEGVWASIPFLVLFQNGFYFIGFLTIWEEWGGPRKPKQKRVDSIPVGGVSEERTASETLRGQALPDA